MSENTNASTKKWLERIEQTRKCDEAALKQMATDRKMARGDSQCEVDANLLATYIDITSAFLYARNPQPEVMPARATEPPSIETLKDAAADGVDPVMMQVAIQMRFDEMQAAYRKRQRENKAYAETCELLIERLWHDGRLKARAKRWVRSALTVGMGVLKASWMERMGKDPQIVSAINDLQDNIKRIKAQQADLEDKSGDDHEAAVEELERQILGLQANVEVVQARGFAIDFVPAERIVVPSGYAIGEYLDAPWVAQEIPMTLADAKAEFELTESQAKAASKYKPRKPEMKQESDPIFEGSDTKDAFAFVQGESDESCWVMVWEIWDNESNSVLTAIEGVKDWVKPAWNPCPTTRFYPFFVLCMGEIDGQRYPQSLVSRSAKLINEYNRIGSAEAVHRRRTLPKTAFNAGRITPECATRLANGGVQEMVAVDPINPMDDLGGLVLPVSYAQLDPALYDRARIVAELERIWGIQEALSGAVSVAKTATEAEIQQGGFQARSGARRDELDSVLSDLALYTAEVAAHYVKTADAVEIVGPDAFWPEGTGPEDLRRFVNVDISAGSSGKPNTTAEREAWATQLPLLQQGIVQIGQLRNSSPEDIADALEKLLRITAERSGDRIDIDSLVPQSGVAPVPMAAPIEQPPIQA